MSDTEQIPTITKVKRVYTRRASVEEISPPGGKKRQSVVTVPDPEPVPVQETPMVKPKRERTEKQILAFKKMQEKRKEQDELKKINKSIEKDKQIHDTHSNKIQKLKDKIISNASLVITNNDDDVKEDDSEDEIHIQQKKVTPKKSGPTRKPRISSLERSQSRWDKKTEPVLDDDEEDYVPTPRVSPPRQVSNDLKYIFV